MVVVVAAEVAVVEAAEVLVVAAEVAVAVKEPQGAWAAKSVVVAARVVEERRQEERAHQPATEVCSMTARARPGVASGRPMRRWPVAAPPAKHAQLLRWCRKES